MSIIFIPNELQHKAFAVYEIDHSVDYSHTNDMIPTNAPLIFITICEDPQKWLQDNCGCNEVPLAWVTKEGKIKKTFAAQIRQITFKPKGSKQ